jgi:hypothetical protein
MVLVEIQNIIYFFGSFFSFILLILILIQQIRINKKGLIKNCLIIIAISEIINSIHNLIYFLKNINNTNISEKICDIQKGIGTFSDICTPLMSLIIAREINYIMKNNDFSSFGKYSSYIIYLIGFFIPLIIEIIFYLIDINYQSNSKKNDTIYPCTINEPLLFYLYGIFWIIIIISLFYSISSLIIINQKKEEYLFLVKELKSDNNNLNNNDNVNISYKLNNIYRNNLKYPITMIIIWFFVTIIRIIHFIYNNDKNKNILEVILFLYVFINSFRGIIYCFVYLTKNDCFINNNVNTNSGSIYPINDNSIDDNKNQYSNIDDSRTSSQDVYSI